MPITEKCAPSLRLGVALALAVSWAGCTPPGPRAVLQGDRLVRQGRHAEAVQALERGVAQMPREARAWNLLGLARHGAGQPEAAAQAYRQALQLDRNLAVVHFNLGSLLLEQGDAAGAAASLTSYCGLQSNDPDGWMKLGTAQLRSRQADAAERSFQNALKLQPRSAEAVNGLGVALVQRRRYADAQRQFTLALNQEPGYAPALLNAAIVAEQHLNNRALALDRYREYLALPSAPHRAGVEHAARRLEADLAPAPQVPSTTSAPPPVTTKAVELPPPTVRTSAPAASKPATTPNNGLASAPPAPSGGRSLASKPATNRIAAPVSAPVRSNGPVVRAAPPVTETVRLEPEPVPQPARDVAAADPPPTPSAGSRTNAAAVGSRPEGRRPSAPPASVPAREKTPLVQRLNPATWFRSKDREATVAVATPSGGRVPDGSVGAAAAGVGATGVSPRAGGFARYPYSSHELKGGDREMASRHFQDGVRAQERNRLAEAIEAYQKAVTVDASFFEARYNLGMAAFEGGRLPQSLSAYEAAVRLRPESANARYNFAITLERAGYPVDAAAELERLVAQNPAEARGHLAAATLYARTLGDPKAARLHYLALLELEPTHPQATEVRFWLEANP